jgi:hypothetical protein
MRWTPVKKEKCQGDHGGCGADYRCCIPALAGFVSPHSMGPGAWNLTETGRLASGESVTSKNPKSESEVTIDQGPDGGYKKL